MRQKTFVGLEEFADQAMHLIQDLARREGEVVLQKKSLNGLSSGPGEIEPVEETPVELLWVEA